MRAASSAVPALSRRSPCRVIVLLAVLVATPVQSFAAVITDGFEGAAISGLWDVSTQQNGSLSLSTTVAHSGSQSLQATAAGGGQVNVWAIHDFGGPMLGEFSVWFYDTKNGHPYANFVVENTLESVRTFIGIQDWDPSYYHAGYGPNEGQTSVPRTIGWHAFKITADGNSHDFYIDDVLVGSAARTIGFDRVWLTVSGPNRVGTYYYDDFLADVQPVPEPASLVLPGAVALALIRRRRQAGGRRSPV